MRLVEELSRLRIRAEKAADKSAPILLTEEATKTALVMPALRALGYDVFDPDIVIPEFIADVGIKKGEKIDYAIRINGDIAILIECKSVSTDLSKEHASQLYRYFSVTKARFGILTNGVEWRFFTDLDAPNKMDEKPFFLFSLLEFSEQDIVEFGKFASDRFSVGDILSAASDLKYKSLIADQVRREFAEPSDEFTRLIARRVYEGNLTAETRTRFAGLIGATIRDLLREQANQRLKDAIERPPSPVTVTNRIADPQDPSDDTTATVKPVTTEEEMEGFRIIKAIVRKEAASQRIVLRDAASYCAILFDDNNRKPIVRLYLDGKKKRIGVFSEKNEVKHDIESLDGIYEYADQILTTVRGYLGLGAGESVKLKIIDGTGGR